MSEPRVARNLVVCCDGTWNDPGDEDDGVLAPTNVFRLFNAVDVESTDPAQLTRYQAGVGTGGPLDRLAGGAMGFGLGDDIRDCHYWLADKYRPGDRIFLFGFSRGAFTARSLAGVICKFGIVDREGGRPLGELVRRVHDDGCRNDGDLPPDLFVEGSRQVHFLGVWDTVGALGVPDDKVLLQWLDDPARYRFHDTSLSPDVAHARHAIAIDERRGSFSPTLWKEESKEAHPDARELWFPGVHSDVGGGYRERGLSDGALMWMMAEARGCGLRYRAGAIERLSPNPEDVLHDSRQGLMKCLVTAPRTIPSLDSKDDFHASVRARRVAPLLDQAAYLPARSLDDGPVELDVYARHPWSWTGVYLESGRTYAFTARGRWFDGDVPSGPEGAGDGTFRLGKLAHRVGDLFGALETWWKSGPGREGADFIFSKRVEQADWLELIGAIADGGNPRPDGTHDRAHSFRIGAGPCEITPERGGYLYCFANDAWGFYGNNRGYVTVTVREVGAERGSSAQAGLRPLAAAMPPPPAGSDPRGTARPLRSPDVPLVPSHPSRSATATEHRTPCPTP